MKKIGFLFILAAAFMTFSAQNCKKRDPYVIPGSSGNPRAVGAPEGSLGITVVTSNGTAKIFRAKVSIAFSQDSMNNNKGIVSLSSNDSGYVQFNNLIIGKSYTVRATSAGYTSYNSVTKTDTTFVAQSSTFPGNDYIPVH